jgi:hypothetical protein
MLVKTGIELPAGELYRRERIIGSDLPTGDPGGYSRKPPAINR